MLYMKIYSDLTNRPKAPKLGSFPLLSGNSEMGPRLFSGDLGEGEIQQLVKIYFGGCKKPVTVYK